jgi:hypothetical protein
VHAIPPDAAATPASEIPAAMLEVHAPHETIHPWKNFLAHIAAIVLGHACRLAQRTRLT